MIKKSTQPRHERGCVFTLFPCIGWFIFLLRNNNIANRLPTNATIGSNSRSIRNHTMGRGTTRIAANILMKLVRETLETIVVERPEPTEEKSQGMCLDNGYDYQEVRDTLEEFGFTAHIRSRGEEAKESAAEAGKRARRWVVERTHSWMNRFRRILIRWERKPQHYIAFLHFACALIAFRVAGLFG